MSTSIRSQISSLFTPDAIAKVAGELGESRNNVANAIEKIISLVMHGFSSKAAESSDAAHELLGLAKTAGNDGWWQQALDFFGHTDHATRSTDLLKTIFGHKNVDRIAGDVGNQFHITTGAAQSLMQWVAPACLGVLGRYAEEHNINAGQLAASLSKMNIELDTPAATSPSAVHFSSGDKKPSGGMKMLWPILLLLIAFAAWWFLKGCGKPGGGNEENTVADTAAVSGMQPGDTGTTAGVSLTTPVFKLNEDSTLTYALGDTITQQLPGGDTLRVPSGGAEVLLVKKIEDALKNGLDTTEEGKKAGWVNLYDVQFSKMLNYREGAVQQIRNIAAILKAYPNIIIKLGGYTDNTGPADANRKLSQQRAEKVAASLNTSGVGAQVEKAEGYGADFPMADNATAEGRAQNRRVSCRIVAVKK